MIMRNTLVRSAQCGCVESIRTHRLPLTIRARHAPATSHLLMFLTQYSAWSTASVVMPCERQKLR